MLHFNGVPGKMQWLRCLGAFASDSERCMQIPISISGTEVLGAMAALGGLPGGAPLMALLPST